MNCLKCEGSMTSPQGITLKICPFCGEIASFGDLDTRNIELDFHRRIQTSGLDSFSDKGVLDKLISDLFFGHPNISRALRMAVSDGTVQKIMELLAYDVYDQQLEIPRITKAFAETYGFEYYYAKDIVRIFAYAFRIENEALEIRVTGQAGSGLSNVINERGNSVGNIVNEGLAAKQGDWIFFVSNNESSTSRYAGKQKLHKIRTDGSGYEKLNDDHCRYINVIGDWIYYRHCTGTSFGRIYKVNVDGTSRTQLNEDSSSFINVVGEWIYYCNETDGNKLYKMRIDGSAVEKISDDESFDINAFDDWVYYVNRNDGYSIYKIRTDGSEKTKLNNDDSSYVNVIGDWIYYANSEGKAGRMCDNPKSQTMDMWWLFCGSWDPTKKFDNKLYRMRTDGSNREKLDNMNVWNLNVSGEHIYFLQDESENDPFSFMRGGLTRMRIDGSDMNVISSSGSYASVVGDFVYYYSKNTGMRDSDVVRVRTDGSDRQAIG